MNEDGTNHLRRIGFVSTRIRGTDGVSLEIAKWAEILTRAGHECFFIAGELDTPADRSQCIAEAHFLHPVIDAVNQHVFGRETRDPYITEQIHEMRWIIKEKLLTAIRRFDLDLIIAENCLSIPLNIPLGLAVVETVMETGIGCWAHHHDFPWERERFLVNSASDYLQAAFPPAISQIHHIVINSQAAREFSRRISLPCQTIPNVMDFDRPPGPPDDYAADFRAAIGLRPDDILVLQPTRVVRRKGIEHSVELIRRLKDPRYRLVITHSALDEGPRYGDYLRQYADLMGVELIFADALISHQRGVAPDGSKQFSIWDAYRSADLVAYPSTYEGFGNAFLETIYFKKPIVCNRYAIYRTDIEPYGFKVILMDGFVDQATLDQVRALEADPDARQQIVEHNYQLGKRFFSYCRVAKELQLILARTRRLSLGQKEAHPD